MARDHNEMRAIIVDAAREVFSRFGYKKATLDDIASSLYKAKSSIYYYFKSKEDVFRAVLEYESIRAKKIVFDAVENEKTPEAKLRIHFKTINDFIMETTSYYKLMHEEMLAVLSFSDEVKCKHIDEATRKISSILREGIASGVFAMDDPDKVAQTLQFAFDGLFSPWYKDMNEVDDNFEPLMDIIFNGIKTR